MGKPISEYQYHQIDAIKKKNTEIKSIRITPRVAGTLGTMETRIARNEKDPRNQGSAQTRDTDGNLTTVGTNRYTHNMHILSLS